MRKKRRKAKRLDQLDVTKKNANKTCEKKKMSFFFFLFRTFYSEDALRSIP